MANSMLHGPSTIPAKATVAASHGCKAMSKDIARGFAYAPWLNRDLRLCVLQGVLPPKGHPCQELAEFADEIARMDFDLGPAPCKPSEFREWANALEIELAEGFGGVRQTDEIAAPLIRTKVVRHSPGDVVADREHVRAIASELWDIDCNFTIEKLVTHERMAPYARKYRDRKTLPNWIRDLNPNKGRRGRRPAVQER